MEKVLEQYRAALEKAGAASAKVIQPLKDLSLLDELTGIPKVTVPDEFRKYLMQIDGYDRAKCSALDIMDPDFAWGMEPIPLKKIVSHNKTTAGTFKDKDYWPIGFVAFLWSAGGDEIVVNCLSESPTCGAVYYFEEGVGVNRISDSLSDFIVGCTTIIEKKFRVYEDPEISQIENEKTYREDCSEIYGNTPYFNRRGKFDTKIIDWK